MDLSLRTLRYFVAVAEVRHFGRAAERLMISQPGLSQQIKRFERQVGCKLLERSRAGVRPTAAGRVLLEEARVLLERSDAAVARTRRAASPTVLRIACVAGTPHQIKSRLVKEGDSSDPCLDINLIRIDWSEPFTHLRNASVDAAVMHLPHAEPGVTSQLLHVEPRVAVLPAEHRLSDRSCISIGDIAAEPVLDSNFNRDFWLVNPRPDGSVPVTVQPAPASAEQLMDQVAVGRGIAITAKTVSEQYRRPGVVAIPIIDIDEAELALIWYSEHAPTAMAGLAVALAVD
ncbi:MAG: LysR family transcriptional regulator [Acidimicrobiaceae bacterium]|nr:LysR family transcriptional regulator [Acidimicrobiaceae bacterium]